jgi:hypothetical protein
MIPYIAAIVIFQLAKWRMSGNPHLLLAVMHFILTLSAVVCVLPLGTISFLLHQFCTAVSILVHMTALATNYPTTFSEIKANWRIYLSKVSQSPDFQFLYFTLIFLSVRPVILVYLILARRSHWFVGTQCSKNGDAPFWSRVAPLWAKLQEMKDMIDIYSVVAEQCQGLILLFGIFFPGRQVLGTFLYWSFLKHRYVCPRSRPMQEKGWAALEGPVVSVTRSKVGLMVLAPLKKWFTAV